MDIKFDSEKEIVIREAETKKVSGAKVKSLTDNFTSIRALVSFDENDIHTKELILCEGKEYRRINQWSDEEIETRILELI